jgi:hypothetical protein
LSERRSARRGAWVQIHQVVLRAGERAPQVPAETQAVPLELWAKGFLLNEQAAIGDQAEIETVTGRRLRGELSAVEPVYEHGFGQAVPELMAIGSEVRALLGQSAYARIAAGFVEGGASGGSAARPAPAEPGQRERPR